MKSKLVYISVWSGILFGLVMIAEFFMMYNLDFTPSKYPTLGILVNVFNFMILPLFFIVLTALYYRLKVNQNFISFSEVLRVGVIVCVMAAMSYALFNLVYYRLFPDAVQKVGDDLYNVALYGIEQAKAKGALEAELPTIEAIQHDIQKQKEYMTSFLSVPFSIIIYSVIGIICSIVTAPFIKNDKPQ
ncbi:MAG: DUF4199 domain-containing protein [Bacteroidota bacterium]|nr:DUF4199 domain-containing protein [Bacteroidota bacterium]